MASNKRKSNKQKNMEEKKLKKQQETSSDNAKKEAEAAKAAKEAEAAKREAEKKAELDAKMAKVSTYKGVIATLAAICFAFIAGIAYNWYCTAGHMFDDDIEYLEDVESTWHMFNGRYVRARVDSVFKWYDGVGEDELTGELVMTGDTASCIIWLNSSNFMSLTVSDKEDFDTVDKIMKNSEAYIEDVQAMYNTETATATDAGESGTKAPSLETADEKLSIYLEGQIKRPENEKLSKYKSAYSELMREWGFEDTDYYMYELTLDTSAGRGFVKVSTIVYIVFAVIFFVATIIVSIKYSNYKRVNGIKIVRE